MRDIKDKIMDAKENVSYSYGKQRCWRKCDPFTKYKEKEAMIPATRERMNLSCCKKWMTEKIDELGQEVQVLKKQKK